MTYKDLVLAQCMKRWLRRGVVSASDVVCPVGRVAGAWPPARRLDPFTLDRAVPGRAGPRTDLRLPTTPLLRPTLQFLLRCQRSAFYKLLPPTARVTQDAGRHAAYDVVPSIGVIVLIL